MIQSKILEIFYYYFAQTGTLKDLLNAAYRIGSETFFVYGKLGVKSSLGSSPSSCIHGFFNSLLDRSGLLSFVHEILGSMMLIFSDRLLTRGFNLDLKFQFLRIF
jgi:hypothetical protein